MRYNAFISYSHAADGKLAPALQRALERYAKPWYRRRALHIFRDETDLAANPDLWQTIIESLSQAEWFILMASPEAARSKWVSREIEWWLEHRTSDRILILLTEGEVNWNENAVDFDWDQTTAIPREALRNRFRDEPLYVDLRWARSETNLTLRHTEFRSAILRIAAPIHGMPMDEMDGDAVRTYKKNITSAVVLVAALIVALVAATWQWRVATVAEAKALRQAKIAQSRELASRVYPLLESDPQLALNLAVRAAHRWETEEAETALRRALAMVEPGRRQALGHVGRPGDRVVALSNTAKYGVTLSGDRRLAVWQLRPQPRQILGNRVLVGSPLFSRDERLLATRTGEGVLTVWSMKDGQRIARFEKVRTAIFAARRGLTYLRVDSPNRGSLFLWDPKTHTEVGVSLSAPNRVRKAIFHPRFDASYYITVDDSHVDAWNFYGTSSFDTDRDRPAARYTDPHGISEAWFSDSGQFVVTTNANGSSIVRTVDAMLTSHVPLRSLRTVAFNPSGEFMVAVPRSGRSAVVHIGTGDVLATLPEQSDEVAAATFGADGETIVFSSPDGAIWQRPCTPCLPFERLLKTGEGALTRPLTLAEREVYLHEQRPSPCPPIVVPRKGSCLELAPDSGPPGTVVEVSVQGLSGIIHFSLTDRDGKTWQLASIETDPILASGGIGNAQRVGTLTIPAAVPLGPATIRVSGTREATRSFSVICLWCEP